MEPYNNCFLLFVLYLLVMTINSSFPFFVLFIGYDHILIVTFSFFVLFIWFGGARLDGSGCLAKKVTAAIEGARFLEAPPRVKGRAPFFFPIFVPPPCVGGRGGRQG